MTAVLDVLFSGYVGDRVDGTVSLIRSGDAVVVVDPGMVPDRAAILDPLLELGVEPPEVTDVVLSHHHPDHTVNIAHEPGSPTNISRLRSRKKTYSSTRPMC